MALRMTPQDVVYPQCMGRSRPRWKQVQLDLCLTWLEWCLAQSLQGQDGRWGAVSSPPFLSIWRDITSRTRAEAEGKGLRDGPELWLLPSPGATFPGMFPLAPGGGCCVSSSTVCQGGSGSLSEGRCSPSPHMLNHDLLGEGLSTCNFPSLPKD